MKTYILERHVRVPRPLESVFEFFSDPRNLARITPPWLAFEMVGWQAPAEAGPATAGTATGVQSGTASEAGPSTGSAPHADPTVSDRPVMTRGLVLHYRVRPLFVAQRWTSLISAWDPPNGFTDEQVHGPYRLWRHRHTFEAIGDEETVVGDHVEYALPFGPLGRLAHLLLVKRQLRRIFEFRLEAMREIFEMG